MSGARPADPAEQRGYNQALAEAEKGLNALTTQLQAKLNTALRQVYMRGWRHGLTHGVLLGVLLAAGTLGAAMANRWL